MDGGLCRTLLEDSRYLVMGFRARNGHPRMGAVWNKEERQPGPQMRSKEDVSKSGWSFLPSTNCLFSTVPQYDLKPFVQVQERTAVALPTPTNMISLVTSSHLGSSSSVDGAVSLGGGGKAGVTKLGASDGHCRHLALDVNRMS